MTRALTEKQTAVLAAISRVQVIRRRYGWRTMSIYVLNDADVSTQVRALLRHKMVSLQTHRDGKQKLRRETST